MFFCTLDSSISGLMSNSGAGGPSGDGSRDAIAGKPTVEETKAPPISNEVTPPDQHVCVCNTYF